MDELLVKTFIDFALNHPSIASVILFVGGFRIFFKPVMELAKLVVAKTASDKDDKVVADIENSKAYKLFMFAVDYLFSIKKIK